MIATCQRVRDLAPGFVLGALEPEEMLAVREHLEECDKPHPEITELGGVVPYLAQVVEPVEPPESLKNAIVAAARADLAERNRRDRAAERLVAAFGSAGPRRPRVTPPEPGKAVEPATPAEVPEPEPAAEPSVLHAPAPMEAPARVASLDAARARRNRVLRAVAGIAAAIALVFGVASYLDLQNRYDAAKKQNDAVASVLHGGAADKATVRLVSPSGGAPWGAGAVQPNGHLQLALINLPSVNGDDVYEIWLIDDAGTATPVEFTSGGSLAQLDIGSPAAQTAAQVIVTREHGRDAKTPSQPVLTGRLGS